MKTKIVPNDNESSQVDVTLVFREWFRFLYVFYRVI